MWRVWVRRGEGYRFLVGKPEGKRSLGRPRRRWVDNIRVDLQKVGRGYPTQTPQITEVVM